MRFVRTIRRRETETTDFRLKVDFRDRLRRDTTLAKGYNDNKLELAAVATDKSSYAAIKDDWVAGFIKRSQ